MHTFIVNPRRHQFICEDVVFRISFGGLYTLGTQEYIDDQLECLETFANEPDFDHETHFLRQIITDPDILKQDEVEIQITDQDIKRATSISIYAHAHSFIENGYVELMLHDYLGAQLEDAVLHKLEAFLNIDSLTDLVAQRAISKYVGNSPYARKVAVILHDHAKVTGEDSYVEAWENIREALMWMSLNWVKTSSEIESRYKLQAGTVRQACGRGKVTARKADERTWLIHEETARETWSPYRDYFKESTTIVMVLSRGEVRNSYIRVKWILSWFPRDTILTKDNHDTCKLLTLDVQGFNQPIQTEIDGIKLIFRKRGWVRKFFKMHNLQVGDHTVIEKIDDYHYRITAQKREIKHDREI